MSAGPYRLVVLTCALSWLLVGMHSPVLHEMIDHGATPRWPILALVAVFVLVGTASMWALLRLRVSSTTQVPAGPRAT